jgi:hypothetical protein
MTAKNDPIQTQDGHTVVVDSFRPQDAEGIGALFRDVYGDGYPIKIFYDPEALIRANETGDCCSIVARNESGRVVGASHVFRSAPYQGIYESGAGMVLKTYRNQGIMNTLESFVFTRWAPARPEVAGLFGEPVCNHVHLQKTVNDLGAVDMAIEATLMPAEAYTTEKSAAGRVACVFIFLSVRQRPHTIYLPSAYEEALRFLYSGLHEERFFTPAIEPLPIDRETRCQVTFFDFAAVSRVAVQEIGADLKRQVRAIEEEATAKGGKVLQVWVNLGSPWSGAAVDALREEGYFLGGLLPRWFDNDGLLMQKLFCPPDWEGIQLYTDRAKEILKLVRADFETSPLNSNSPQAPVRTP